MRADVGGPPPGGPTAPPLNDSDLEARARDVAQFLGINPDQLAAKSLQAVGDEGARAERTQKNPDARLWRLDNPLAELIL
jgi:hypothetical protein